MQTAIVIAAMLLALGLALLMAEHLGSRIRQRRRHVRPDQPSDPH